MTLGERLLEYRTNLKMSQDVLAEKLGVTRQTVSKWETNQSTPEFNKIIPLCEVFGITTDELIKGEREEKDEKEEELKMQEEIDLENKSSSYNEKRNKKKALAISISTFLYIIGMFIVPFLAESPEYGDGEAIMVLGVLWAIATAILIYFFVSNPKEKVDVVEKKQGNNNNSVVIKRTINIINLFFLLVYLLVSFITSAWNVTWMLWIVCAIVDAIVRLVFDVMGGNN